MGVDIHIRMVKMNRKDGKYQEVKLYRKNESGEIVPVWICDRRNYELFDILQNKDNDGTFPSRVIYEASLPEEVVEEVKECRNETGYYGFYEANLADIKLYLKDHPKVRDYDWVDDETFEKEGWKDNPVKDLVEEIQWVLNFADPDWYYDITMPSDVKIVYWFDC